MDRTLEEKEQTLVELLQNMKSVLIAYSGGVDSTYLAFKAHQVLGPNALAITAESPIVPEREVRMARQLAEQLGLRHEIARNNAMELEVFRANPPDRCFYCKDALLTKLKVLAAERGMAAIADGVNADDPADFRPGLKASEKHNIRSPLLEAGLRKEDIRELSRRSGLPTADRPSAACLASRIPYGLTITEKNLRAVERGEEALRALGFRVVRVRHHDTLVRLEFGKEELGRALTPEMASRLVPIFKELGYKYVTIDLEGFRSGSLNEVLGDKK